jgi:hypothetical protein
MTLNHAAGIDNDNRRMSTKSWDKPLLSRLAASLVVGWASQAMFAADASQTNAAVLRYEEPKSLTARIYAKSPGPQTLLFNFKRLATRSGSKLNVLREYTYPDGRLAVRQHVAYEGDELVGFEVEELQNGARGNAKIRHDPASPAKGAVSFEYAKDTASGAKPKTNEEPLRNDTLMDDMIGPFLALHWGMLLNGQPVKCRYISVPRRETVGFTFTKDSESTWQGQKVIIVKMEATSFIIAALVDPVFFTVEKEGKHRILRYIGRTTPKIKTGSKWADLDAVTLFDWK